MLKKIGWQQRASSITIGSLWRLVALPTLVQLDTFKIFFFLLVIQATLPIILLAKSVIMSCAEEQEAIVKESLLKFLQDNFPQSKLR